MLISLCAESISGNRRFYQVEVLPVVEVFGAVAGCGHYVAPQPITRFPLARLIALVRFFRSCCGDLNSITYQIPGRVCDLRCNAGNKLQVAKAIAKHLQ